MARLPFIGEVRFNFQTGHNLKMAVRIERRSHRSATGKYFKHAKGRGETATSLNGKRPVRGRYLDVLERGNNFQRRIIRKTGQQRLIGEINDGPSPAGQHPAGNMILPKNGGPQRQTSRLTFDFQWRAVGEAELLKPSRFNPQAQVIPISAQRLNGNQTHADGSTTDVLAGVSTAAVSSSASICVPASFLVKSSASMISCCRWTSAASLSAYSNGVSTWACVSASRLRVSAMFCSSVPTNSSRCWTAYSTERIVP